MSMNNQTVGRVIKGNTDRNPVSVDDPDFETFHCPRQLGRNGASVLQGNDVVSTSGGFGYPTLNVDQIVLGQD
jgi:hypothetical protein